MKPITSRIKRSPLFSYGESPAKQTAKSGVTITGKDEKTEKDANITNEKVTKAADQCKTDASGKIIDTRESCKQLAAMTKDQIKASEQKQGLRTGGEKTCDEGFTLQDGKCVKIEKGEEKDIEFDLMEMKSQGTMLEPWELYRQKRTSDKANREVYSAQRKMAKYGEFTVDEKTGDKIFKPNSDLSQKQLRQLEKAQSELKVGKNLQTNVQTGTRKGVKAGQTFERGQREVPLGKRTEDQQKAQAVRADNIKQKNATVKPEEKNATVEPEEKKPGQAGGAVEVEAVNPFAGIEVNMDPFVFTPDTDYMSLLRSSSKMTKKGYTQKAKSPAAKALKGAQNKLPQHLQDAIKTAPGSPAKLGPSPLKKGYFKSK
jgi:hypothetical protein